MDTKQLYVANLNLVFGKKEEPLIQRVDDIVLPALNSGIIRKISERTSYIFEDVCLKEISHDNWAIQGILIKDTMVDVMSEYKKEEGLQMIEKHVQSSPYSLFILYLKNHRMLLVKNQSSSPDIRSFSSVFKHVINAYVNRFNEQLTEEQKKEKLPKPRISVTGIKTAQSVKESLKNVEKINELVIKFYPLNAEWDYDPLFGGIDEKIRKTIGSKKGKMVFPSPQSKDGVAEMIEATEGLVKTEMRVTYKVDERSEELGQKRTGKIKDDQISEVMTIDMTNELNQGYDEVDRFGRDIQALNVQSQNQIVDYNEFLARRRKM